MIKRIKKSKWVEHQGHDMWHPHADRIYEKKLYRDEKNDVNIYIHVAEYLKKDHPCKVSDAWEIDVYLQEEVTKINKIITIKIYCYFKKDLKKFEQDARSVIERLIN